ncbi:MAG TPA: NAD(P)H-hydrate dehydratase [Frankiaceae bacterium]|nr:NAD(P)H-hydrate dehydratase [Frankiaceae bacterium]
MRVAWTVSEVRAAEAESGVAEHVLIDRASTAVARRGAAMLGGVYGARVLVAAGPGHNGADALWAADKLRQRGAAVDVYLPLGEPRDEHGAEPLRRLRAAGARGLRDGVPYDLTIDGILGVGGRVPEWDEQPAWAPLLAHGWRRMLAVDVPTGLDADTGRGGAWTVRATATVTFGRLKPGLVVGASYAGLVEVAPIGLGPTGGWSGYPQADATTLVVEADDVASYVGTPPVGSHKFHRGVVGVCAGSEGYPGAAALACRGAQRAGCGYVRLVAPGPVADLVRAAYPEVVAQDGHANAWVVGPGLGTDERALGLLREALATNAPVVVDADAITLLAQHRELLRRDPPTVLTPHTGEFERLTGVKRDDAESDPIGVARAAAADLGCVVLLKGPTTVVSDGRVAVLVPTGTPWLATAGTGDVLAGVIGSFLVGGGRDTVTATAAAAWLHGMAARVAAGEPGAAITAHDVAERLPDAARIAVAR